MNKANIINIERCATDDGPGLRTAVFFKGCKLRCKWCANPESQLFKSQVIFYPTKCIGDSICMNNCPENAIELKPEFGYISNPDKCTLCGKCIDLCFAAAREMQGKIYSVEELLKEIDKDKVYYERSGGGVTFSGGEPLFYSSFIRESTNEIHKRGWNVLVETCGYVEREHFEEVYDVVDYIFYDFKEYDPVKHKELTGEDNKLIIENLLWLCDNFKGHLSLRYPFIRGMNDSKKEVCEFLKFASKLKNIEEIVFLPYHRLGTIKYQGIGREYEMKNTEPYKIQDIQYLKDIAKEFGLEAKIY